MPYKPRRGPKPFVRPSVDLNRHGKEWLDLRADQIRLGDIVYGCGSVRTDPVAHGDASSRVTLDCGLDHRLVTFDAHEVLRVFGVPR